MITEAPPCLPPRPPLKTAYKLPAGTCDTHFHVFGHADRYPLAAQRSYTPQLSTIDDYADVMATFGIDRAVLVQPSVYGTDNRALLDALRGDPARLRGVVVVPPDLPKHEIASMHALGVRGVRFNRRNAGGLSLDGIAAMGERIQPFGWHIELQIEIERTPDLADIVGRSPVPVVIDHFGFADPEAGPDAPGFRRLLACLEGGRTWVKLSAPYRISRAGAPYPDVAPLADALLSCRPDRLLWATDWPHTELWDGMPYDGDLIAAPHGWRATLAERMAVLIDNPERLYWTG